MAFPDLQALANAALFSGAAFGEPVAYTPPGGVEQEVQGILSERPEVLDGLDLPQASSLTSEVLLSLRVADLTAGKAEVGAHVVLRGVDYDVRVAGHPDDSGIVKCALKMTTPEVLPPIWLDHIATLGRLVGDARDDRGGYTAEPQVVGTLSVRLVPLTVAEISQAGSTGVLASHEAIVAPGTDIRRGDLLWTVDHTYDVISIKRDAGGLSIRALLHETQRSGRRV